ncbi:MAG: GtrA family protein [Alphaproteobacteria bacterium]|nr:GtrA family protein [Alphaproteobacteria bacterium]
MKAASPHALIRAQFLRFAMVGTAGFLVDESVLAIMHRLIGLDPIWARVVSILCAMTFTWWGNRTLTFHHAAARGSARLVALEWLRFIAANSLGAVVNFTTYATLLHVAPAPFNNPYLATVCGVGIGMLFNFVTSRTIVFSSGRLNSPS